MKRRNIISTLACSIVALAFTACTDVWEEHYQPNPELNADETLWELISNDPQLTEFASFLEATGYDTLLSKNRCYTVWAPVNDAEFFKTHSVEGASKTLLNEYRKELVENHIADYSHVAGGKLDKENLVKVLNGKYIRFENASGKFTFKGVSLKESNVPAKNGVLHKIDGYADFTANIWEQLAKEESLDSLYSFLSKDYKREPNWAASVQGPMVDGQIVYLDTAWSVTCPWFNSLGQLNREDSSYTMFALTNKAWNEMFEMTKEYFTYAEDYAEGDSVQAAVVKELMCSNLVFSDKVNKGYANNDPMIPYDTLISNYNFPYTYEPLVFWGDEVKALYNGSRTLALSNGTLNIVDEVNYSPLKCWHDSIIVEGENLKGGYAGDDNASLNEYYNCKQTIVNIDKDSVSLYERVSKGAVGVYESDTENPELDFKINNVLSARYKVQVVVLPPDVLNPFDTLYKKPNLFYAKLTCGSPSFKNGTQQIVLGRKDSCLIYNDFILSDPTKIDVIDLVPMMEVDGAYVPTGVDYVEIPVCEYQVESKLNGTYHTKLEINSCLGQYNKYDLKFMNDYKSDKNKYVEAIRTYNAAYATWLEVSERSAETDEEIAQKEEDLATAQAALDKAKNALDKAKDKVESRDKEYLKYFDTTLRIDQIILVPYEEPKNK